MNIKQVKYITAGTPAELEAAVNLCMQQDNRWDIVGAVNVYDKPNVVEERVWVQTLMRYIPEQQLLEEDRPDMQ